MNTGDVIRRAARLHADRVAVTFGTRSLKAGEVYDRAVRLANALGASGVQPGAHVGVLVPNCAENMEIEFACAVGGFVRVSLNVRLPKEELIGILEAMDVTALIYSGGFVSVAEQFVQGGPNRARIRLALEDEDPSDGWGAAYEAMLKKATSYARMISQISSKCL